MKRLLLISLLFFADHATASQWIQRADMGGNGRHRACGVGLGNRGYMGLGHYNGVGFEVYFNDWWAYDPATNAWAQMAIYPGNSGNGELGCHCWTYDNKVYVGLGEIEHEVLYRFDPTTNSWEQMTSAPAGINFQDTQEMILADKAYFTNVFTSELYQYHSASDSWSIIGAIPIPLNFTYSACTFDDNFWIKADLTTYMYETATELWYQVVSAGVFPGEAVRGSADFFLNGKFYIVGGYGATFGDCSQEVWQFDPVTYQWTQLQDFPGSARRFAKSFVIGNRAYICTGTNGTNFNDLWEFNPTAEIDDLDDAVSIQVFPNPATDYIQFRSEILDAFELKIFDLNGNLIRVEETTSGDVILHREQLPAGTYLYAVNAKKRSLETGKFVFE